MLGDERRLDALLLKVDWIRTSSSVYIFSVGICGKGTVQLKIGLDAGNKHDLGGFTVSR